MTLSLKRTAVTGLALAALAVSAPAAAQEYVPFVTDFPQGRTAEFVPFVTDFGREQRPSGTPVVLNPRAPEAAPARDVGDLALGGVAGFAFAALLVGMAAGLRRIRPQGAPRVRPEAR
jgi:hypothetical protein